MKKRPQLTRSFPLLDLSIDRSGDGRTVTAYAATFDDPYEVRDKYGHYYESIHREAFHRAIGRGIDRVSVFYNHGLTINGTPSDKFSLPVGVPLSIKPETRGLLTVTRYAQTDTGDEILEAIADGRLRAQSFRGPIFKDAPVQRHASGLPLIERLQLGLVEYGPTPIPVNHGAEMVSLRSLAELVTLDPEDLTDDERAALAAAAAINDLTPPPAPVDDGTADGSADGTPPNPGPVPSPAPDALRDRIARERAS